MQKIKKVFVPKNKILENIRAAEYNYIGIVCECRRIGMNFLTTAEQAKIWNVSQRRVAIYCKEGRIKGAILKGSMWLIPEGTEKPEDPRRVRKIGHQTA